MSYRPILHPWNDGFSWRPSVSRGGLLGPSLCEQFNQDGYLILRDVLPVSLVDSVRALSDELEAKQVARLEAEGGRDFISEVGAITFNAHLVSASEDMRQFARHDVFASLTLDLVGQDVNLYWDQTVYKQPEKPRRFPWHQDNGYTYVEPQQYLTCWVPLVRATLENGCPQLVPAVHREGTLRHSYVEPLGWECFDTPPREVAVAEVSRGDVVIFSSLTPHMTGPNLTDATRKAYILQYAPVGAAVLKGDPQQGPPIGRQPCDDQATQPPILRAGEPATR